MGVIADFLAATGDTINTAAGHLAVDRAVCQELADWAATYGDFDYPSGYGAQDEVQSIAVWGGTPEAGTFTLEFTLASGLNFTTGPIAYDANAATIEGLIDTAATAADENWVAGAITVTGGPLTTTPVVLTFDGAAVDEQNHADVVVDASSVTGTDVVAGAVTTTTSGQGNRLAWAILKATGAIGGAPLPYGTSGVVTAGEGAACPVRLSQGTLRALAKEAAFDDGNATVETNILTALNLS